MKTGLLIVGGGVTGLFTAVSLLDHGYRDITIVEKSYIGSGGTFRCATGIRASFTSREHVNIMKRAIDLWPILAEKLGFKYRRDGYLWVLTREKDVEFFKRVVEFHHSLNVPTRMMGPEEVKELIPSMNTEGVLSAVHDPLAGKASVFNATVNAAALLKRSGVKIYEGTQATRITSEGGRLIVETNRGRIEADKVLVAAARDTVDLVKDMGAELPIRNLAKHVLITEAFKPVIKPLIIDWSTSSYILQVLHGNIYIGADIPEEYDAPAVNKYAFLEKAAGIWVRYFPWLSEVYVLRYWVGYYDMTPDHHPIVGPLEENENVIVAAGFSGHGFMMAPAVAEALASYILGDKPALPEFENLKPERFRKGRLIKEIAVFG
ncbi:NAD(P)/FAD-dependent oxidoreductase [Desulfurococcus mucosus]|uniref:FAD dependent oxidoreductase n=1 Tax=Desulfurococcus mucosus (strain ATCC 35584 / DSM 2162 / JCM 9187 / O7/1) TaxID=765177 RepID=E8R9V2_DESM0|nr:FAD-binding oxidoreductase [Desulfurococcus mucosus]ADV65278.1 FAD dependent oxidoreductase [Desulfurococcus mucosus DSM 2162]